MKIILWIFISIATLAAYKNIQAIEPTTREPIVKEELSLDIEMEKINAITYLNELRSATGLVRLNESTLLNVSANNHAKYLLSHKITAHNEVKGRAYFTGETVGERAKHIGYKAFYVSENISGGSRNYKESIDGLFSAIYHRFGFLDFKVDEVGIGIVQDSKNRAETTFVYNMGISTLNQLCSGQSFSQLGKYIQGACFDKDFKISEQIFNYSFEINHELNTDIAIYPYDGEVDVPPAFFKETPDPLPDYDVSGFPISISFDEEQFEKLELESFRLFDEHNQEVENSLIYDYKSDINHMFKKYEFALFPLERLEWESQYFVEVVYRVDGVKKSKKWSFSTRRFSEKIVNVTEEKSLFTLERGVSSIFYFRPTSPHDLLSEITFPTYVDIGLIDENTIRLVVLEDAPSRIDLDIDGHELHLNIENSD